MEESGVDAMGRRLEPTTMETIWSLRGALTMARDWNRNHGEIFVT